LRPCAVVGVFTHAHTHRDITAARENNTTREDVMAKLNEKQIQAALRTVKGWKLDGGEITKTVTKKDFVHAMGFVQQVALVAEKMNHHPDIDIRWNKVKFTLSTHSEGGLTTNDFELAKRINGL
jgi:4a-hydroxytetrahydrobiopterin dehydratase